MITSLRRPTVVSLALLALHAPLALADAPPVDPTAPAGTPAATEADTPATPATTQPACTWYAAPNGSSGNSGRSTSSPLSLLTALNRPSAGQVVCLMAGTYSVRDHIYLTRSGTATAPVVYRNYGGAAIVKRASGGSGYQIFKVASGTRYVELNGLTLDGSNIASNGVLCDHTSHVRLIGNTIQNMGSGGLVTVHCDYLTAVGNRIWHVGYRIGWSSAISLNTSYWSDSAAGFHSYIVDNVIGGTNDNSGKNSDGNGIIVDLGDNTPPALIANNLVYMNYARCIHSFHARSIWVVNNTCYKNTLREPHSQWGTGEINFAYCSGCYAINNIVNAWTYGNPYRVENGGVTFSHNLYWGGKPNMVPAATLRDANQLRNGNPLFSNPIAVNDTGQKQWVNAPSPSSVLSRFTLRAGSPGINTGVDPRSVGLSGALLNGFNSLMSTDLAGHPRVHGAWDMGAYES
jgi:hypothetical protein